MTARGEPTSEAGNPRRALERFTRLAALAILWATGCSALQPASPQDDAEAASKQAPTAAVGQTEESAATSLPVTPSSATPPPDLLSGGQPSTLLPSDGPLVWGLAGVRGYGTGSFAAPNGVDFNPLFSLDLNFNLWLYKPAGVYAFTETRFWGQKAAPGITNPSQGAFDFSKREFDLDIGVAWNYAGSFEARAFVYSMSNLNRGTSLATPYGFKDGTGLENRWYVGGTYADLGQPGFDVARATFLSLGYYPSKEMVDAYGIGFKPGPFARAYLTYDLFGSDCYLYADVKAIATKSFTPKLLECDEGIAIRPFANCPRVEFRAGSEGRFDFKFNELNLTFYGAVRFIY